MEGGSSASTTHDEPEDVSEARFTLKYLGSTLVETPSSEEATAEAIKTVITMVRAHLLRFFYDRLYLIFLTRVDEDSKSLELANRNGGFRI